jgi:hypothetical protein
MLVRSGAVKLPKGSRRELENNCPEDCELELWPMVALAYKCFGYVWRIREDLDLNGTEPQERTIQFTRSFLMSLTGMDENQARQSCSSSANLAVGISGWLSQVRICRKREVMPTPAARLFSLG